MNEFKIQNLNCEAPIRLHGRFSSSIDLLEMASERFSSQMKSGELWWRHLTYLVIDSLGVVEQCDAAQLGDFLASAPMKIIADEHLHQNPRGMKSCLQKLRPYPLPSGYYRYLIEVLCDGTRSRLIHHTSEITVDFLDVIRIIPDQCLCPKILGAIKTSGQAETLVYLVDAIRTFLPEYEWDRLWRSTQSIGKYDDLGKWFHSWLVEAPFPSPPWEGNVLLRPIKSAKELLRISREHENCIRHFLGDCIDGAGVFYRWMAGDPVIVSVRRDPFFGWVVDRMEGGRDARHVSDAVQADILEQFLVVGIRKKPTFENLNFAPYGDMN